MTRRLLAALLVAGALSATTTEASAQLNPGIHVARAADVLGGATGVGGSLRLSFPLFPIDLFVAGDYFFPDCGAASDCSFLGGSADVHLSLPSLVLSPYGTAGLVYRRADLGAGAEANTGFGVGVGLSLGTLIIGAYAEARYEFVDPDDQLVLRVGIRF